MSDENFDYLVHGILPDEYLESVEEDPLELALDSSDNGKDDKDGEDDNDDNSDYDDSDENIYLDHRDEDMTEEETVRGFLNRTCGCQLRDGSSCSTYFSFTELINYRADIQQLTKSEIDLVLLTCIRNSTNNSEEISKGSA